VAPQSVEPGHASGAMPARESMRRRSTISCWSMSFRARRLQHLGLVAECDREFSVVLFSHGSDRLEQRAHSPPLDVAARGWLKIFSTVSRCSLLRSAVNVALQTFRITLTSCLTRRTSRRGVITIGASRPIASRSAFSFMSDR